MFRKEKFIFNGKKKEIQRGFRNVVTRVTTLGGITFSSRSPTTTYMNTPVIATTLVIVLMETPTRTILCVGYNNKALTQVSSTRI